MSSPSARQADLDAVFAMLAAAAGAGEVCPTNRQIADRLGWRSVASANRALYMLERAGRIQVESTRNWRLVTIAATGRRTAWNGRGRRPFGAAARAPVIKCLRESDLKVFAHIEQAANASAPCPRLIDLAVAGGMETVDQAKSSIDRLARAGRIRVLARARSLPAVIQVCATGARTAGDLPDAEMAKRRWILSSAQGRAENAERRRNGGEPRALAIRPGFAGGPAQTCQYIEGEPTADDSCKCGKPSAPGFSWCADHKAVVYQPPEAAADLNRRLGIPRERERAA